MDLLDQAEHQQSQELRIRLASNAAIVNNMHRSKNSTGLCVDCGKQIPPKRLECIPGALRCVTCQTAFEEDEG